MDKTAFDLSMSQTNILDLEQSYIGTPMNTISCTIQIEGQIDFERIQSTLNSILKADASLRIQIRKVDGNAVQWEAPWQKTVFPTYDFSQSDERAFRKWVQMMAREPISLDGGPLYRFIMFRTGARSGGILVKTHHIISDGWTQMMLCNRIAQGYLESLSKNIQKESETEYPSYRIHVEQEQEYLNSKAMQRDRKYWEQQLGGEWQPLMLKQERSAACSPLGHRSSYQFSEVLGHKIYQFCMEHRVSPFLVFYLAFAVYFQRRENISRFSVGVPLYNRTTREEREMSGMFVSTLPFICGVTEDMTVLEAMEHIALEWFEMMRHEKLPFSVISNMAARICPQHDRLFHIAISYQDSRQMSDQDTNIVFAGEWFYNGYQAEHLCIHLQNREKQNRFSVDYDYLLQIFSQREIDELHESLVGILEELFADPERKLGDLDVMRPDEAEQVLYTFNRTERYRKEESVPEVLCRTAQEYPARRAVICKSGSLDYGSLLWHAAKIRTCLKEQIPKQRILAIMLPRDLALFKALTGAVLAGYPWILLPPQLPDYRVEKIVKQTDAVVITQKELWEQKNLTQLPVLYLEQLADSSEADVDQPMEEILTESADQNTNQNMPLYLVYTSGSSGEPKGVEVGAQAFLNFAKAMRPYYSQRAVLSICNQAFDAFLIESLAALLNGKTIVLASEESCQSPAALGELIRRHDVGFLALTPSRLRSLMTHRGFRESMRQIDRIVCGGESFPEDLVDLLAPYTDAKIFNQYGPSEAAVGVTIKCMNYAQQVTVGSLMDNCRAYVLNQNRKPLPVGARGNLYLGGRCLANGYFGNPDLTREKFIENPFEWQEKIYDTGDLAAWTPEGELVLYGRRDHQVKLRGLRLEPEEISACMMQHADIKNVYVCVHKEASRERLCIYYTGAEHTEEWELREFLAQRLPAYMIPDDWICVGELPLTANGKIDVSALPLPACVSENQSAGNQMQRQLLQIFTGTLPGIELGVTDDYFRFGGNSLTAMEVLVQLEEVFHVTVSPAEFYANATVLRMESYLRRILELPQNIEDMRKQSSHVPVPIPQAPIQELYPTTAMQQMMYVQSCMPEGEALYHMPGIFYPEMVLEEDRFWKALQKLIEEEPMLRTSFVLDAKGVFQKLEKEVRILPSYLAADTLAEAKEEFMRPFDLKKAPLMRCALFRTEGKTIIFMDLHHLIADGISTPVLLERLSSLYESYDAYEEEEQVEKQAETTGLSFLDYAFWKAHERSEMPDNQKDYWTGKLGTDWEKPQLPLDEPRCKVAFGRGKNLEIRVDAKLGNKIRSWCKKKNLTEFMLFSGAFGLLLAKITGVTDPVMGTPVSGRNRPETMQMFGPLIQTLPLCLHADPEMDADDYLSAVREDVLTLLEQQETDREDLEALCGAKNRPGEPALFDVLFSMRPLDTTQMTFAGKPMRCEMIFGGYSKFRLSLEAAAQGEGYLFDFQYMAEIFRPETIAFYGRCLVAILEEILEEKGKTLAEISGMNRLDRYRLLEEPNYAVMPFLDQMADTKILHVCERMPDADAVRWHGMRISHRDFSQRATKIAGLLQSYGVEKGMVIGICCQRTPDMFAAMLAVLMTGAAYMPMLPEYPKRRMLQMCEQAEVSCLLCDRTGVQQLPDELLEYALELEENLDGVYQLPVKRSSRDAFCVLFTSGTTGEPKGMVLTHHGINHVAANLQDLYRETDAVVMCTTNMIFDTFLAESLLALQAGKTVVLADEEEMMLPWKIAQLIRENGASFLQMTPSRMRVCLENQDFCRAMEQIRCFLTAGEVLDETLVKQISGVSGTKVVNLYGPAEGTVYASRLDCLPGKHINIGKPFYNNRIYLLDEKQRPVLPTAVGEIYLAGAGVTDGYLNQPERTQEVFLPDLVEAGEKMYRTGDFGRLRLDGTIDFCGRADHQVKLNGQRVELDEIAGLLQKECAVQQAVVVPIREQERVRSLRAFYVPEKLPVESGSLAESLGRSLPSYMIPAEFYPMKQIPLTASGKADLHLLQEAPETWKDYVWQEADINDKETSDPERFVEEKLSGLEKEVAYPDSNLEDLDWKGYDTSMQEHTSVTDPEDIRTLWCEVLERKEIREEQSFFEQGGTSLAAMQVMSGYYERDLEMTMEQFFAHPTLLEQWELLGLEGSERKEKEEPNENKEKNRSAKDRGEETEKIIETKIKQKTEIEETGKKAILLTGTTGFLGAHLLDALLRQTPVDVPVVCGVRKSSLKKLMSTWNYYFGEVRAQEMKQRVQLELLNLTEDHLGLMPERYQHLAGRIGQIWHCAADVRHFAADNEILRTNLDGTRQLLTLAQAAGADFEYVSTISVGGSFVREFPDLFVTFDEDDYDLGQNWEENQYIKSKFLAEGCVREAYQTGLGGHIFRVGCLVGRNRDGKTQINIESNAFYQMLNGLSCLKSVPEMFADIPVEMMPVDLCAEEMLKLQRGNRQTCHLTGAVMNLLELTRLWNPSVQICDIEQFQKEMAQNMHGPKREMCRNLYERMLNLEKQPLRVIPENEKTLQELNNCGGIRDKIQTDSILDGMRARQMEREVEA